MSQRSARQGERGGRQGEARSALADLESRLSELRGTVSGSNYSWLTEVSGVALRSIAAWHNDTTAGFRDKRPQGGGGAGRQGVCTCNAETECSSQLKLSEARRETDR